MPGFETSLWFALVAPAEPAGADRGAAQPRGQRHHLRSRGVKGFDLQAMQSDPIARAMADLIRTDLTRWREIAAKAGVKGE